MNPLYLLDPWLVELNDGESLEVIHRRYDALQQINVLHDKYGMRRAKFVTWGQLTDFYNRHSGSQRRDVRAIGQIATSILLEAAIQNPSINIEGAPCPALSTEWLSVLAEHGSDDDAPNWRKPIIFTSESRSVEWPDHVESRRELKYRIVGNGKTHARNLVLIESHDEHAYFEPDLDPWRYGAIGTPPETVGGAVGERREALRRLPRLPEDILPLHFTFSEIVQVLRQGLEWSCERPGRAYYIPPEGWDPRTISKDKWRSGHVFPMGSVKKEDRKKHNGPIDREGRIWLWDMKKNHHWDVQLPNGSHVNVSHDGMIHGD